MSVSDWSEEDFERDREQCERIDTLEELVGTMYRCIKKSDCWHCPLHEKADELRHVCVLRLTVRELGRRVSAGTHQRSGRSR